MAKRSEFVETVVERMQPVAPVTARAMFGGWGLFCDGVMFALVADDVLYLKADAVSAPAFDDADLPPFTFAARGRTMRMSYRQAPEAVFDDDDALAEWTRRALEAAWRAR